MQIDILKNGRAVPNKIEAVEAMKVEGYRLKDGCEAFGFSRSLYYSALKVKTVEWEPSRKDKDLWEKIKAIKAEHPF